MGLRCLLGHNFGEPELRREREEDGTEVVTTVTEVKTCARCGETQVVSENTEVTTMEQLTGEAAAADPTADSGTGAKAGADADPAPASGGSVDSPGVEAEADPDSGTPGPGDTGLGGDAGGDDAVIIDDGSESGDSPVDDPTDPGAVDAGDSEGESAVASTAESSVETDAPDDGGAELIDEGPSSPSDGVSRGSGADGLERDEGEYAAYPEAETAEAPADEERAETDDGVILDEEGDAADDRERGAWPDVDESDGGAEGATPWPEHRGEDEGFSAEVGEGDAGEVEFGGGLTPEAADPPADGEDAEYVEAPSATAGGADDATGTGDPVDEGVGITRGDSPDLETSTSEVTTEYYCPECEMIRDADGNSMRAGDICPECKRGYVDERPI